MKTVSMLLLVSSLGLGCAGAQLSGRADRAQRGVVAVDVPSVKAIAAGPADIHAYSGFAGGAVYTAALVSGTDRDCDHLAGSAVQLEADRVAKLRVDEGQVACLTTTKRNFELLWRAVGRPADRTLFATSR